MASLHLTDSGLETWLIFHRGVDLPDFAAFPMLDDEQGRSVLADYYRAHAELAVQVRAPLVLETPTWRASAQWGARLGYDAASLDRVNRDAVAFLRNVGSEVDGLELTVSGNLGPRGDGYDGSQRLTPDEAAGYHRPQIAALAAAGADRVTMLTATHTGEAVGIVRAAQEVGVPVVVAFTVETNGCLPSGQALFSAIAEVDDATGAAALHYGINCAHPDHFATTLEADRDGVGRIGLLRANASRASHAELDEAEELDEGDPAELGAQYAELLRAHPHLQVLGGCCGTDVRHVAAIAAACLA